MSEDLPFTGERFVPGDPRAKGEMWYEHWHRYHFALSGLGGARVLDVACGEGYGSALMAGVALKVTGADISPAAIAHARATYGGRANLEFVEAPCTALPFADASFDVVVSFETLEHISGQASFLDEVRRVLVPDGLLLISTPNKAEYSDRRGYSNEFHVKELYRGEFESLLAARFAHRRWLSQRNAFVSLIEESASTLAGESRTVSQAAPDKTVAPLPALYYMVLASGNEARLAAWPARISVFSDAEEWAFNDYRETYKGFRHYLQREKELEAEIASLRRELEARAGTPAASQAAPSNSPEPAPAESALTRFIKRLSS